MGFLYNELNDTLQIKELIKNALIEKGFDIKNTDSFRNYANKIEEKSYDILSYGVNILDKENNIVEFIVDDNLKDMDYIFSSKSYSGQPVCGNNTVSFNFTYAWDSDLTGSPVCGENVKYMEGTYTDCYNLTGTPVIGNKVTEMSRVYYNCGNLTGNATFGPLCYVNNFYGALSNSYLFCNNLTGVDIPDTWTGDLKPFIESEETISTGWSYDDRICYPYEWYHGAPFCGNNITNISELFAHPYWNLSGSPACGDNVIDMSNAYYGGCGENLIGPPACGANVENMSFAYYNCQFLTGNAVSKNKVIDMNYTYYNCYNLNGYPSCGNNVVEMFSTYERCYNLTGSPVCGDKVINMINTYRNCWNLIGEPVCGRRVVNMFNAYRNCVNLTGNPVCGDNVIDMFNAYENCWNLNGYPTFGSNVRYFNGAYINCFNLIGYACFPQIANTLYENNSENLLNTVYYGCKKLEYIDIPYEWTNLSHFADGCYWYHGEIPWMPYGINNMAYAFANCTYIKDNGYGPKFPDNQELINVSHAYEGCCELNGSPICPSYAEDVSFLYARCYNLIGSPVISDNAKNFVSMYHGCSNLTGSPVINEQITDNSKYINMYYGCSNLTGDTVFPVTGSQGYGMLLNFMYDYCVNINVVIPDTWISMHNFAFGSRNWYNHQPTCGNNIEDFSRAWAYCENLTGSPICGEKVTNMKESYINCFNLIGTPVCKENVVDMNSTYEGCYNLTGSPACKDNVKNMERCYYECINLNGHPVCGNNVINMSNAYYNCSNLTGSPAVGLNVKNMSFAYYGCCNIYGKPGDIYQNNINLVCAYSNCPNIYGDLNIFATDPTKFSGNMYHAFYGKNTENKINIRIYGSSKINTYIHSLRPMDICGGSGTKWTSGDNCYYDAGSNIYIYYNLTQE